MPEATGAPVVKKRMSGCVIALLVGLGFAVFGAIVTAIVVWRFSVSPTGQRVVKAVGDTAKIMYKAQSAPGANEVRKVGNCDQAFVVEGDDLATIARDVRDSGVQHAPSLVTCQVGLFWEPPTCELLAKAYVDAVRPKGRFIVNVKKTGSLKAVCQETFEADGSVIDEP